MNKLKNFYPLTCLALAILLLIPALGQNTAAAAEKSAGIIVAVSGYGEQDFVPDTVEITLGVQTEAATVALAQNQNAKTTNLVMERLLETGIKKDALKTASYSVSPVYQTDNTGARKQTVSGYRASNYIVITTSPDKAAQIIDTALKNGANRVTGLRFSLKDDRKAKQEVIALAVRDALDKIDSIAKPLGKKVGSIISVNEQGTNIRGVERVASTMTKTMEANDSSYEPTPISPGTITISANLQINAELE